MEVLPSLPDLVASTVMMEALELLLLPRLVVDLVIHIFYQINKLHVLNISNFKVFPHFSFYAH